MIPVAAQLIIQRVSLRKINKRHSNDPATGTSVAFLRIEKHVLN